MIDISKLKIGDKVCYQPDHYSDNEFENGMVKEIRDNINDSIFVVYNCAGNWNNFRNYTSVLTNLRDLKIGWRHE